MNSNFQQSYMKKTFSLMLACLLLATTSQPVEAAQLYPTVEAAKAKVTDDGYILFIYPKGWDKYGEKLCKKLTADKELSNTRHII